MAEHSHHDFKGLLFVSEPARWLTTVLNVDKDMDGTLVDSLIAVESAWAAFAVTYPHLRIQEILKSQLDLYLFGLYLGISQSDLSQRPMAFGPKKIYGGLSPVSPRTRL